MASSSRGFYIMSMSIRERRNTHANKTMLNTIFNPFYHIVQSFWLSLLPAAQLLQAHYLRRKFAIKVKYAEKPVIVRGKTSDVTVFYEIFALKIYKIPQKEIISIVDIGANVGYASIYFAYHFPKAHIIAVEPENSNHQTLLENTQNCQNISCVHAAIWPEETELALQNPGESNWSFHYQEAAKAPNGPVIKTQTVPGLMENFRLKHIDLLKIDIEGGEQDLFAANTDWLRLVDCLIIEIHSNQAKQAVFHALAKYSYTCAHDGFNNYYITLNHSAN
jgi:FkbM family methyltransferase